MAKLVLGKTPENFKSIEVKFTGPDGEEDAINIVFRYMTRTQYAAFLSKQFQSTEKKDGISKDPVELDFVELYKRTGDEAVARLTEIIAEWDFEEPPTAASLRQMHDQAPAAAAAIGKAFAGACNDGRLGN